MNNVIKTMLITLAIPLIIEVSEAAPIQIKKAEIQSISSEIQALHKEGVALHQNYNFGNMTDLQACSDKSHSLRAKAKALRPRAMDLNRMSYRMNLALAADAAFSCVYCSERTLKACREIPALLKQVQTDLASEE